MIDTQQFATTSQATADKFFGTADKVFQGLEAMTTLNLQVAKTLIAESVENVEAFMSARSPEDVFKLQAAIWKAAPEKSIAYGNQVKAILESMFAGQRGTFEASIFEAQAQFVDSVSGLLKDAPGSEAALSLVKSGLAASNDAYQGVSKTTQQMADVVEANVKNFTTVPTPARKAAA